MNVVKEIVSLKQVVAERNDIPFQQVTSSLGVAHALMEEIGNLTQEHLVVCCLNSKNFVNYYSVVHIGTTNTSLCFPKDIIQRALLSNSNRILISHNHRETRS